MGRIKEISRKSVHTRKRNPVVYLICEGSETEIRYFKRFRSRGCNIDIIPISSQYKSADKLVQKAKATMGNNPYYPEDGDSIWCVFDRDDNSNEVLLRAKQSAQKEGYHLAYSNPSFELWFLLHFVNQQTEVEDCQALIRLLKQPGRLPDYEKNKDYFDVLKPLQITAIQRAKTRAGQLQNQDIEPISRQSNPLTTVWELVEYFHCVHIAQVLVFASWSYPQTDVNVFDFPSIFKPPCDMCTFRKAFRNFRIGILFSIQNFRPWRNFQLARWCQNNFSCLK